ncbi:hypothetical protein [Cellulomonas sp. P5_C5]
MRGLDRSAAFWLRAYPRRWRAQSAAEVAEVLSDVAPAGATRLDVRAAAGLVRAGWSTRWRQRPPLGAFLRYRLRGRRPPRAYDGWLRDDLEGALYPWRAALLLTAVVGSPFVAAGILLGWPLTGVVAAVVYAGTVVDHARGRAHTVETLFGSRPDIGPMGPYRLLDR